jgi:APA family basic amino acid/polyamine antiporter
MYFCLVRQSGFGFWSAFFLVIANMIGTGIYTTTGFLVADLPAAGGVLMLWVLGGVAALGGGLSYAALAKRYPRSGGEYHFLSKLYHPALGFLAGVISIVAGFSAPIAASAYAFGKYLPLPLSEFHRQMAAVLLIIALTGLHTLSLGRAARIQNLFVLVKIGLLLALIIGGLVVRPTSPQAFTCPRMDFSTLSIAATALIFISYAYSGWNAAAYIMSEVPRASEIIPRAIPAGTLTVMALYAAFNFVLLWHLPVQEISGKVEVGRLLAQKLWGEKGDMLLGWGISLAMVSSVSAMLMISPRVLSVMGEDYPLFRFFSRKNTYGSPTRALALIASLAIVILFLAAFDAILNYIGFLLSLFAGLTVLGLFLRHSREKGLPWVLGIFFLLLTAWMVINNFLHRPYESLVGLGTILAGLIGYLLAGGRR